tara:strand:+ start:2592 stop:2966 length:375 start_codon:yes stop_codon:yes gene_type:complete
MSFSSEVDKAVENIKKSAERKVRGTLMGIFGRTITRTPVDSGRLRNNWHTEINKQAGGGIRKGSRSGGQAIANAVDKTKKLKMGDTVYFSNNMPYAYIIEHGHHSKQAPRGMLRVSIKEAGLKK